MDSVPAAASGNGQNIFEGYVNNFTIIMTRAYSRRSNVFVVVMEHIVH